ncbi:hypothetical protein OWP19_23580 [Bacillus cereus]|uniref:hypothetical protein n=1 Tax=Bacillus cereus TaxID=1396 RepID=UPI0025513082|nr:hypothetical protein [Bacillus cereus]MDK7480951.1 hypothetical protein [Bacillus cereus]
MIALETKDKRWHEMRKDLLARVEKVDDDISRITNGTPEMISIDGGRLGYVYDFDERSLSVWGKASRCSGGSLTAAEIKQLEETVQNWQDDWEAKLQEAK